MSNLDQFYTKKEIAEKCLTILREKVNINNYDCVIVTGKSVVAQAIIIADQLNIPICTVQKPFGYPWFLFQYQYLPYHDMNWWSAKNQIPTLLAPNTMEYIENNNRDKKIRHL